MIKYQDAIRIARQLIGTPYSELDCINLIKKVIRTAPGGVSSYTTAGTNTLWRSYDAAAKYRDLTWRQTGLAGAKAGMLAFKADGEDVHHVGIVTGEGTVIHSSSTQGGRGVVETSLTSKEGWTHLAVHRYIGTAENATAGREEKIVAEYKAKVTTQKDPLTLRNVPEGDEIGKLPKGSTVSVMVESGDWAYVSYAGQSGYASMRYLTKIEDEERQETGEGATRGLTCLGEGIYDDPSFGVYTRLVADDGTRIALCGAWYPDPID